MSSRPLVRVSRFIGLSWAMACTSQAATPERGGVSRGSAGPVIDLRDSLVIDEPDSLPIGANFFIARDGRGRTYINDMAHRRVLRFSPTGRFGGAIGGPGKGPGEFVLPGVMGLLADDSILAVNDVGKRVISMFEAATGRFLRHLSVPAQDIGQTWTTVGDTVVFAAHLASNVVLKWAWRSDSIEIAGATPPQLLAALPLALRYGRSEVAVTDFGFLALFPTESRLHKIAPTGTSLGTVAIPFVRRLGGPLDFAAAERAARRRSLQPLASGSAALHRLTTGHVLVAFLDFDQLGTNRPSMGNYRLYLSLLSPGLDQACVDGLVPIETDVLPLPAFRGDSMFLLSRVVMPNDRVRTTLYHFGVSPRGCDWLPTRLDGPP